MAVKAYKAWDPGQGHLLPPSPLDWLPADHLVHFLLEVVSELDLSAIEDAIQAKDPRGQRPYPPRMMVGLLLYGYCVGLMSSRKLEAATYEHVGFRVLCAENHPDHATIASFRSTFLDQLSGLFVQVLKLCSQSGLVKLGHVALDGTKVQGNASKHKAMSYSHMEQRDKELEREVDALLQRAEETDAAEDELHGRDKRGDELPEELRSKEKRRQKIREAKQALEAEAARAHAEHKQELAAAAAAKAAEADEAEAERAQKHAARSEERAQESAARAVEKATQRVESAAERADRLASAATTPADRREATAARKALQTCERDLEKARLQADGGESDKSAALPEHRVPFNRHGDPEPKAQRNFTDADSRIMKTGNGYLQGYNCQAIVDEGHQIIVAQAATNQAPDQEHLQPLVGQAIANCGRPPTTLTADAGYWSAANEDFCEAQGVDAFIAPNRKLDETGSRDLGCDTAQAEEAASEAARRRERMREKVNSDDGRAIYKKRKHVVEPVFGQIKEARGFRRFLLRGIERIRAEWAIVCTAHNLLKLRAARRGSEAEGATA